MFKTAKVGIITILKVNNYGAELQAYATQKAFELLGTDAEIIDYLFYKNPRHKRTTLSTPTVKHPLTKKIKEWLYPIITKWKSCKQSNAKKLRNERFERFHLENTKLSPTYESLDSLKAAQHGYDILISGSDQVWNPGIYSSLDPYFLKFGPDKARRIAYASSFGVSEIPQHAKRYYQEALSRYLSIGVRENTAVELIENLTGQKAEWVLDPTLLLTKDQWLQVAKPIADLPQEPYILIYELGNIPYIKQLALHLSKETDMPIVRICQNAAPEDKEEEIINIIDAGPAEFLYIFDKAHTIVTNSFHGTAFSLNFSKNFYTIIPSGKLNNSRQMSLLKLTQCEKRGIKEGSEFPTLKLYDIEKTQRILQQCRDKSIDFILKAMTN